jgi:hypothetical protein
MKTRFWTILPGILIILSAAMLSMKDIQKGEKIPGEVKEILSNSCYACHTAGAKAENAVKALDFKKWNDYEPTRKVGKLNSISEVLEEGAMPPGKFLKKYPEKALSEEDKGIIFEWTKKETAKLME